MAGPGRKQYAAVRIEEKTLARWNCAMLKLKDIARPQLPGGLPDTGVTHSALMDEALTAFLEKYFPAGEGWPGPT